MGDFWGDEPTKRTLGIRDRKILWRNAKGRCQNPKCNKKIEFDEMQVGHKTAASRGGRATFKNCVCLCWRCNNNQGTDSWPTFLKKQGIQDSSVNTKRILKTLSMPKLKLLAQKKYIKVKGSYGDWDGYSAPTKTQYINKLAKVVSVKEIETILKNMPQVVKKKRKRRSSDDWL